MPRTILCTIGTSIAGGTRELLRFQKEGSAWADDTARLQCEIAERLKRFDLTLPAGRIAASAELNSLQRLNLEAGDEVVLLATDTADGHACAEALAKTIQNVWVGTRTVIERVEGLQVRDAERLRKTGLSRLIQIVLRYVDDPQRRHGGGVIINPTGGFKGVVPFLTVVGMLFRVKTVYVFEFAESLIYLPPLPIGFDLQLFLRARPAMAALRQRHGGVMPEAEFYNLIPGFHDEERTLFQSLLEVDGAHATLSPLADALARYEEEFRCSVWLSPKVKSMLDALLGLDRTKLERMLIRLPNPVWRTVQSHPFPRSELPVFGNRGVPYKIAARVIGRCVYVCSVVPITSHEEYEESFARLRLKDFEDFRMFTAWTPPQSEDDLDLAESDELSQLRHEVATFRARLAAAEGQVRAKQTRIAELSGELAALQHSLKAAQKRAAQFGKSSSPAGRDVRPPAARIATDHHQSDGLKGTVQDARYVREELGPRGGRILVFELECDGVTRTGTMPADATTPPIRIGDILRVRVAGVSGRFLQLGRLRKDTSENPNPT